MVIFLVFYRNKIEIKVSVDDDLEDLEFWYVVGILVSIVGNSIGDFGVTVYDCNFSIREIVVGGLFGIIRFMGYIVSFVLIWL